MDFKTLDERFNKLFFGNAAVQKLWSGARWMEGSAYSAAGKFLIGSGIHNDRVLRYDETDGAVSEFERPALNANAHSSTSRAVWFAVSIAAVAGAASKHDGRCTMFASHWQAERLNSPNDLVVKSDGSIWFSDPTYGIDHDYEGDAAPSEIGAANVFRSDPSDGSGRAIITDVARLNGLAFSPDERRLLHVSANARDVSNGRTFGTCSAATRRRSAAPDLRPISLLLPSGRACLPVCSQYRSPEGERPQE